MPQSIVVSIRENIAYFGEMLRVGEGRDKQIETEHENLKQAVRDGLRYDETVGEAAELALATKPFIRRYGYWTHWIIPLRKIIQHCADNTTLKPKVQMQLVEMYHQGGQPQEALTVLHEIESASDSLLVQKVNFHKAVCFVALRDYSSAQNQLQPLMDENVHPLVQLAATNLSGVIAQEVGKFENAAEMFEKMTRLTKEQPNQLSVVQALHNWGNSLRELCLYDMAADKYREATTYLPNEEVSRQHIALKISCSDLYIAWQMWNAAQKELQNIPLSYLRHNQHHDLLGLAYYFKGIVAWELGQHSTALRELEDAAQIFKQDNNEIGYARAIGQLGSMMLVEDEDPATKLLQEGIELLQKYPDNWLAKKTLGQLRQRIDKQN